MIPVHDLTCARAMNKFLRLCFAAAVLALPLAAHAQSKARTESKARAESVTVIMTDNQFRPDHITLRAGRAYRLRLENRGMDLHEFTAPKFWQAAVVRDRTMLVNGGTDVVIPAGKSVVISLIAPAKGHYGLSCADHDWDGMVGTIVVE